ncbi:MAG: ABC transporter permease [Loktanella sp.]|nr:ABC transporter permease [Loktanella sp.]
MTGFKGLFGITTVVLLIVLGLFSQWVAPHSPSRQDLMLALTPPDWSGPHILGTDHLGRDIFSRIIHGARVSLIIATAVALFASVVGVGLGVVAGYFRGIVDSAIQKLAEIFWSFPPLMLAIAIVAFVGQGLTIVIVALTAQRWIPYCRVTRAETMALREREFILAARTLGAGHWFIMRQHILPNVMLSVIVMTSFAMANAIIAESSLSFLGLGVPPTIPTWGGMLSDSRSYISSAWWMALFPGLAIFLTVLGLNLLGDAMRNQFDPKLKSH